MSVNKQALAVTLTCVAVVMLLLVVLIPNPNQNYNRRLLRYFDRVSEVCQEEDPLALRASKPLCPCVPPNLKGRVVPDTVALMELTWDAAERLVPNKHLQSGGHWTPDHCEPRRRLAVVIPYRDRERHLRAFLAHTHPILQRQLLEYRIFVVEQDYPYVFNKASMMNIGYIESQKIFSHDCVLFHDVDLLMENDQHIMACGAHVHHIGAYIDAFNYTVLYPSLVGGAVLMSRPTFSDLNGYSNDYYGWGGEDDDLERRMRWQNKKMERAPRIVASYASLTHRRDVGNPEADDRRKAFVHRPEMYKKDGLNNLKYSVVQTKNYPLYTWIHARLEEQATYANFFNTSADFSVQNAGCSPEPDGTRLELSRATCKFTCERDTSCVGFYYRSDPKHLSYCVMLKEMCQNTVPSNTEQIYMVTRTM